MVHKSLSLTLGQSFEHIILYTYNGAAIFFPEPSLYMEYGTMMLYSSVMTATNRNWNRLESV